MSDRLVTIVPHHSNDDTNNNRTVQHNSPGNRTPSPENRRGAKRRRSTPPRDDMSSSGRRYNYNRYNNNYRYEKDYRDSRDRDRYYKQSRRRYSRSPSPPSPLPSDGHNDLPPGFDESKAGKRTIFISQLPPTVDERDIMQFLSSVGKVRDVQLIRDRFTGRSRGFGFVEFYEEESVYPAVALAGKPLRGFPVQIKVSDAYKNVTASGQAPSQGISKLYIGDIPDILDENDLRLLFGSFGYITSLEIRRGDDAGTNRELAYGFVKFKKPENARKALLKINGLTLGQGCRLKVGLWNEEKASDTKLITSEQSDLEDGDSEDFGALGVQQRLQMSNYRSIETNKSDVQPTTAHGLSDDSMARRNIRISNMFVEQTLKEDPDFDKGLRDGVEVECSRFGNVLHVFVDKHSSQGQVYVRFENVESAKAAQAKMHGRWFDERQLRCEYISDASFNAKTQ